MKILKIAQRTEEWYELRRSKIGASNSPALIPNIHPYKKPLDVYNEMALGKQMFINSAMQHGIDSEQIAREQLMRDYGQFFAPAVCVNDKYPTMMASLDCINEDGREIIEIKCPSDKVWKDILISGDPPIYWIYQVQHQLLISEAEIGALYIWRNDVGHIYPVEPDIKKMLEIELACNEFYYKNLLEFKPPKGRNETKNHQSS